MTADQEFLDELEGILRSIEGHGIPHTWDEQDEWETYTRRALDEIRRLIVRMRLGIVR